MSLTPLGEALAVLNAASFGTGIVWLIWRRTAWIGWLLVGVPIALFLALQILRILVDQQ